MNRDYHNMPYNDPLVQPKYKLPATLIREYRIEASNAKGETFTLSVCDNHQRFVRHDVNWKVNKISFLPISTHGCDSFRVFDFEIR